MKDDEKGIYGYRAHFLGRKNYPPGTENTGKEAEILLSFSLGIPFKLC